MDREQDHISYALTSSSHSRKKKQKKHTQIIPSNQLGFIPPSSESEEEYIARPRNKRKVTHKHQVQKKFNFRNRHHFIVDAETVSLESIATFEGISPKEWELIKQVIFTVSFNHPIVCPICLNGTNQITDSQITACGHVFCSPCILRHIKVSKKQYHCPVCNQFVNKSQLKPCVLLGSAPTGQNKLTFVLRVRLQGSNTIYNPQTLEQDLNFSKFIRATKQYLYEEFQKQKTILQKHLKQYLSEGEEENVPYITEAMDIVNQNLLGLKLDLAYPGTKNKNQNCKGGKYYSMLSETSKKNAIYFYQEEYGRLLFLHPICNHYLCEEFLSNQQLPLVISSHILYKQSILLDMKTLRRYKYLNHHPEDTEILFVEVNMNCFLQKLSLQKYNKQMGRHKDKIKQKEVEDEKRNQQIISKRLAKKIAREKVQYVVWPVDNQIKDLKSCNKNQDFPSLPSQFPMLISHMSQPTPEPPVLKEPQQTISMKEFDFPQINTQKRSKNQIKPKGKKSRKKDQQDITGMMFQPPEYDQ